ncbi:MAG: hypothetical protein ACRBBM_05175 [Pseudomonadaceae bacterium]
MFKGLNAPEVARNVGRRVKRGTRCYVFSSSKEPGVVHAMESHEELKRAMLLDVDPRVQKFRDQPWTMDMDTGEIRASRSLFPKVAGRKRRFYTPDSECHLFGAGIHVVEVKQAHDDDSKYPVVAKLLGQHGYVFHMLTGTSITDTLLRNVLLLQRVKAEHFQKQIPALLDVLEQLAAKQDQWDFLELAERNPFGIFGVFVGLAYGIFSADMSLDLIGSNAQVRAAHGDLTHLELGFV